VLAIPAAANNLVLLGDPQQLEQPQAGHPPGASVHARAFARRREDDPVRARPVPPPTRAASEDLRVQPKPFTGIAPSAPGLERRSGAARRGAAERFGDAGSSTFRRARGQPGARTREVGAVVAIAAALTSGVVWRDSEGEALRSTRRSHDRRAVQRAGHPLSAALPDVRSYRQVQGQQARW
jgi:hypothetical protein